MAGMVGCIRGRRQRLGANRECSAIARMCSGDEKACRPAPVRSCLQVGRIFTQLNLAPAHHTAGRERAVEAVCRRSK